MTCACSRAIRSRRDRRRAARTGWRSTNARIHARAIGRRDAGTAGADTPPAARAPASPVPASGAASTTGCDVDSGSASTARLYSCASVDGPHARRGTSGTICSLASRSTMASWIRCAWNLGNARRTSATVTGDSTARARIVSKGSPSSCSDACGNFTSRRRRSAVTIVPKSVASRYSRPARRRLWRVALDVEVPAKEHVGRVVLQRLGREAIARLPDELSPWCLAASGAAGCGRAAARR